MTASGPTFLPECEAPCELGALEQRELCSFDVNMRPSQLCASFARNGIARRRETPTFRNVAQVCIESAVLAICVNRGTHQHIPCGLLLTRPRIHSRLSSVLVKPCWIGIRGRLPSRVVLVPARPTLVAAMASAVTITEPMGPARSHSSLAPDDRDARSTRAARTLSIGSHDDLNRAGSHPSRPAPRPTSSYSSVLNNTGEEPKPPGLPGGRLAIAAFLTSLAAYTVQTEFAQHVQQTLNYKKPFLSL